jgi:hypothetical protein
MTPHAVDDFGGWRFSRTFGWLWLAVLIVVCLAAIACAWLLPRRWQ